MSEKEEGYTDEKRIAFNKRYQRARVMQLIKDVVKEPQIPEEDIRNIITEILDTDFIKFVRIIDKSGRINGMNFKTRENAEDYMENMGLSNEDYFIVEPLFGDITVV